MAQLQPLADRIAAAEAHPPSCTTRRCSSRGAIMVVIAPARWECPVCKAGQALYIPPEQEADRRALQTHGDSQQALQAARLRTGQAGLW